MGKSFPNTSPLATPLYTGIPREKGECGVYFIFSSFQRSLGRSAYPVEFPTLALTDIRGEPREAVEEFGGDGCEGTGPQEAGRYGFSEGICRMSACFAPVVSYDVVPIF